MVSVRDFVMARIAEDEERYFKIGSTLAEHLLNSCATKRAKVAYADALGPEDGDPILRSMTFMWGHHPDYQPEWSE